MPIEMPPDKPGTTDASLIVAKAVLAAVPLAGGPAAELLDLLRVPAAKRQWNWLAEVAERLNKLEGEHRLRVVDVVESDAFVSATLRAMEAVRRTGEEGKRAALRNAVLNVALRQSPDEALTQYFLDWIDRFTEWHLVVLKAFNNPVAWAKAHNVTYRPAATSSLSGFLEAAFPELKQRSDLSGLVWADLTAARLLGGSFNTMMSETGWESARTTELGKQLLRLIEDPT